MFDEFIANNVVYKCLVFFFSIDMRNAIFILNKPPH